MRPTSFRILYTMGFGLLAAALTETSTFAQSIDLDKMSTDANQWVTPSQNYANWRYSTLKQITPANAGKLQVAWTMSTGTTRGLEGQPLVIGNMMYFETSYPNYIYAVISTIPTRSSGPSCLLPMKTRRPSPAATWSIAASPIAMA